MYFLIITIVVHAEYRAIMGRPSVEGCTLYVTSYPCNVCARVIVQAGIDKVVHYKEGDWNDDRYYSSREILKTCLGPNKIRLVLIKCILNHD